MFIPEKFLDWFVTDDNIQFWVAEDISHEKSKIVGTVGLKPPDVIQKAYMEKMSMKNGIELKVSSFLLHLSYSGSKFVVQERSA